MWPESRACRPLGLSSRSLVRVGLRGGVLSGAATTCAPAAESSSNGRTHGAVLMAPSNSIVDAVGGSARDTQTCKAGPGRHGGAASHSGCEPAAAEWNGPPTAELYGAHASLPESSSARGEDRGASSSEAATEAGCCAVGSMGDRAAAMGSGSASSSPSSASSSAAFSSTTPSERERSGELVRRNKSAAGDAALGDGGGGGAALVETAPRGGVDVGDWRSAESHPVVCSNAIRLMSNKACSRLETCTLSAS